MQNTSHSKSSTPHPGSVLDSLKTTLYSLDSVRARHLLRQFLHPPSELKFELRGRGVYFVSNRCNLHCSYCKGLSSRIVPPDIEQFERVLQQWQTRKLHYLHLTGLEPTESPCIVEYLKIARKYGVQVSLSTNGYHDFSLYRNLVHNGLKYISLSLDAHNDILTRKMGKQDQIYSIVSANVKKLRALKPEYGIKIVLCLAITHDNFRQLPEIVTDFITNLQPDDIRLIPVAQEVFSLKERDYYEEKIRPQLLALASGNYPFLRYRAQNFFSVRGMGDRAFQHCYVVLDERTIGGKDIYPCNIYIREQGQPICHVDDPAQDEKVWRWFLNHDCRKDEICLRYCCDVTREYNLMMAGFLHSINEQQIFGTSQMLDSLFQEDAIHETFQQIPTGSPNDLRSHLTRTALNAGSLGMQLEWHPLTVYYLMRAGLLHDIGKSHPSICDLQVQYPLDSREKTRLRQHTVYGQTMLRELGYTVEGDIAFQHHERVDGKGYHNISIDWPMAELVSLADVYSALSEARNHRPEFSSCEALNMIQTGECGCFRPQYLRALQTCHERNHLH